jgi:mannitol operon transcriptional antiterminator
MVSLDSRSIRIINALLNANGVIPTSEVAETLGISPKMVRYRLDKVAAWLEDHQISLHKEYGLGLWLKGESLAFANLKIYLKEIHGYELILNPTQRLEILLFTLLQEDSPIIAKNLEMRLAVSRSTLFSDLDRAAEWLSGYQIELIRKPGFGIQLGGEEIQKRQALVDLIIGHIQPDNLMYALFGGSQNISPSNPTFISIASSPIVVFVNSLQTSLSYQMLTRIEDKASIQFSDHSTLFLILHICIMIVRIAQEKNIDDNINNIDQLSKHDYFSAFLEEIKWLGREINLPISLEETLQIFSLLINMETYQISSDEVAHNLEDMHIVELIIQSLAEVDDLIGNPHLSENNQVVHELALIFEPFVDRLHLNTNLQNPLLEEFISQNPALYHAAEIIAKKLAERSDKELPREEIGYIGMCLFTAIKKVSSFPKTRILVICPMGAITSHLLAERLHAEFPNLEIVDIMSVRKFLANPNIEADAIISTEAHLPVQTYLPVFHVHPLLTAEDVHQIKSWLLEMDSYPLRGGDQLIK